MSKQIIEGKIDKIFVKDFGEVDNYGNQYGVNLNIGGSWYSMGKKKKPAANVKIGDNWHKLTEGDFIEAVVNSVERNGRTYYNIRAADVTVKNSGGSSNGGVSGNAGGARSSAGAGSNTAVASGDNRQDSIMRQSAMGYAAQIVAGTLTSKSDLDQAAGDVVRLANDYLMPYAKYGVTEDETRKSEENELKNQQAQQQQLEDDDEFGDSVPF